MIKFLTIICIASVLLNVIAGTMLVMQIEEYTNLKNAASYAMADSEYCHKRMTKDYTGCVNTARSGPFEHDMICGRF
jgi:hypothetical protein